MADERIKVTIRVDLSAACDALERHAAALAELADELGLPALRDAAEDLRCRAIDLRERPEEVHGV